MMPAMGWILAVVLLTAMVVVIAVVRKLDADSLSVSELLSIAEEERFEALAESPFGNLPIAPLRPGLVDRDRDHRVGEPIEQAHP